jgi:diacylglycerol kinase family enzyme
MSTIKYNFEKVEEAFRRVLSHSRALRADQWVFHLIINPGAGGFNFEGAREHFGGAMPRGVRILDKSSRSAIGDAPAVCESSDIDLRLHLSAYPNHAGRIAIAIADQSTAACDGESGIRQMIISIGGDGTHNEVMRALHTGVSRAKLARCRVFRFPQGSGNDAADAWTPEEAWQLLINGAHQGPAGVVELISAGGSVHHAFNIASIGVDAHIGMVTNRFKDKLPGDFYKVVADLSVPLYPRIYRIANMKISGQNFEGGEFSQDFRLGLMAIGVSGMRTYGHGLWILPEDENVCTIELQNLFTNIKMKKELYKARHGELPYVRMYKTGELLLEYPAAIPAQVDGEVTMLQAEDFPMKVRIIQTDVQIFSGKDLSVHSS